MKQGAFNFLDAETGFKMYWTRASDGPMNLVGHEYGFYPTKKDRLIGDRERLANRAAFLSTIQIDPENTAVPRVAHGDKRQYVSSHNLFAEDLTCDGLLTDVPGFALTMTFADCPTVMIYDGEAKAMALLHCGWKPISKDIIEKAIGDLIMIGAHQSRMQVVIGPGIRKCCYEVGPEVATAIDGLPHFGHVHIDLPDIITARLVARGVQKEKIFAVKECTKCAVDSKTGNPLYFSYRREKIADPLSAGMCVAWFK